MFFAPLLYTFLKNKYLFKCDYQKTPIYRDFLFLYSFIQSRFSHFSGYFMQSSIDVYIIICYNVYIRKRKKRGERKTRRRTNGDKKDRQAVTTSTLKTE